MAENEAGKQEFKLVMTLDELNAIFGILAEGPFKLVSPIMNKIQTQVNEQAPAPETTPSFEEEK